ncbi:hypothetical protein O6H91_04G061700 [Diphasiastrum complanatum]|uniref:Uncharacterized protein n=1 Tax=Diphasiastrum complanatum TaxID=34168 RepID=A0ACC2DXC9_DIPCM|nr:hypothetical protein O6H91_04G061700 [Diphasiastrum complanatum]
MLQYLKKREVSNNCEKEKRTCQEITLHKIPGFFREQELHGAKGHDKVFAAAWLDNVNVLLGTKNNKLLLLDSLTDRSCEISLPCRSQPRISREESCGIHSIAMNISKRFIASGADDPNDVAVFRLPAFTPIQLLKKHNDWIFAATWLTDSVLVTGSRDSTVKLWSVKAGLPFTNEHPLADCRVHTDKVRDLKYCMNSERLATLSQDGTCKIWDPHSMEVVTSVSLHYKRELVCLAMEYPIIAVGSQKYISFIDMRCGHVSRHVESLDDGWGVRSLSLRGLTITCGGGKGRLSFLDLRTGNYIVLSPAKNANTGILDSAKDRFYFETGKGFFL